MDNVIASRELKVERKHLLIEFCENELGRFLRITEEAHGRRNIVIVPGTGASEFVAHLAAVLAKSGEASPV
ncbi:MAG: DNA-binding protein [Verrucomicrobiota bacterium]|nr:DNA-binding protein [Verrucomicrobiota bacterium]